jgi:hypothetical protein
MTNNPTAPDTGSTHPRHTIARRDHQVSDRIYDYIRAGRPHQRDQTGTRPSAPAGSDPNRAGRTTAPDAPS